MFHLDGLGSYRTALRVEAYIKTLSRERKKALIEGDSKVLALVKKRAAQDIGAA